MMPDAVCSFVLVSTVLVVTSARVVHTAVVSDDFHFSFDPVTNLLVGHNAYTCILAPLTHTEQMDIHYGRGMENLEIEMMRDWVGHMPEVKVYHHDPQLSQTVNRWCDNKEIYLLNRSMQDASTTSATGSGYATLSTTSVASNSQFSTPEMTSSQFSTTLASKTSQSLALSSTTLPQFSTSSPALSSLGYFQQSSSPAESTLSPLPIQFSTASSSQPYTTSDSNLPTPSSRPSTATASSSQPYTTSDSNLPTPSSRPSTATESSVTTSNIQSLYSEKLTTETEVAETTTSDSSHFSNQTTGSLKTTSAASNKTTIAIHATATSHHTAKTTISSAVAPFVVYDNATQIKAVIVVGEDCYVYQLSVVETLMVKMGEETKDSLEKALLAMDRKTVSDVTDKYPSILQDDHVKQYCSRQIFSFN